MPKSKKKKSKHGMQMGTSGYGMQHGMTGYAGGPKSQGENMGSSHYMGGDKGGSYGDYAAIKAVRTKG